MYNEQVLDVPSLGAAPVSEEKAPQASDELASGLIQAGTRVRPRGSIDTLLGVVALVYAIAFSTPGQLPGLDTVLALRIPVLDLLLAAGLFLVWPRLFRMLGAYGPTRLPAGQEALCVVLACSLGSVMAFCYATLDRTEVFTPRAAVVFWVLSMATTLTFRGFARALNTSVRVRTRRVLIVGSGLRALRLYHELSRDPAHFELLGFVDDSDEAASDEIGRRMLGKLSELEGLLMHQVVDEVLIALPIKSCYSDIQRAIEVCARVGVESKYLADAFRCSLAKPRFEHRRALPFMTMKVFYDDYRVTVKRAVDFVCALAGLIALSPLMLVIALIVRLTSPGPIIFAQERYGLNKRRFKMYKFRTMIPDAEARQKELEDLNEAVGPVFKIKNDPRVTPIGRFLRKTSLDELPQLFNVLKGDMSLVGPRPLPARDVQLFEEAWFMRRFSVPPGITGLWQVSGRSNLGFDDWVTLDLKYIDEWSLGLDLQILAKTVPAVLRGVGAA